MKGRTLGEKANGPGFRDRLMLFGQRIFHRCGVPGCFARTEMVLTLYIDDYPPASERGWYAELLRTLPIGADMEVGFCGSHATDVIHLDLEFLDNPDLWAPGRYNPPVLPGPGRIIHFKGA